MALINWNKNTSKNINIRPGQEKIIVLDFIKSISIIDKV